MAIKQDILLTVDAVIFSDREKPDFILLVKRKNEPFKGEWVFPGGFVDAGESLEQAALRELQEETSLKIDSLKQLKAYGDPGRDPRGHTVTVAFLGFADKNEVKIKAASDADEVRWHKLTDLPDMGFDHDEILKEAQYYISNS